MTFPSKVSNAMPIVPAKSTVISKGFSPFLQASPTKEANPSILEAKTGLIDLINDSYLTEKTSDWRNDPAFFSAPEVFTDLPQTDSFIALEANANSINDPSLTSTPAAVLVSKKLLVNNFGLMLWSFKSRVIFLLGSLLAAMTILLFLNVGSTNKTAISPLVPASSSASHPPAVIKHSVKKQIKPTLPLKRYAPSKHAIIVLPKASTSTSMHQQQVKAPIVLPSKINTPSFSPVPKKSTPSKSTPSSRPTIKTTPTPTLSDMPTGAPTSSGVPLLPMPTS